MKSMMNIPMEVSGRLEAGNYNLIFDGADLRENVVSIYDEKIPKDMMKAIRNKEKASLTEDQIRYIESYDLGSNGVFENGNPKPRFQNQIAFRFHEKESGKSFTISLYGGPKLNTKIIAFLKQAIDFDMNASVGKPFSDVLRVGDEFIAYIKLEGDFNNLDVKTIRKVGLSPLATEEGADNGPANNAGFTQMEQALIDYFMGPGKGMDVKEIAQLHTKGVSINGITLNDFGPIANAWSSIKAKVKQFKNADGKIDIILK